MEEIKSIPVIVYITLLLIGIIDDRVYKTLKSNLGVLARTNSNLKIHQSGYYSLMTTLTPVAIIVYSIICFWHFHWAIPILLFFIFILGKVISPFLNYRLGFDNIFNFHLYWIYFIQPILIGYLFFELLS